MVYSDICEECKSAGLCLLIDDGKISVFGCSTCDFGYGRLGDNYELVSSERRS